MEYLRKQCKTTVNYVAEVGDKAQRYINIYKINTETANETYMRHQIQNIHFFLKYQSNFNKVDIRNFLVVKKIKNERNYRQK